MNLVPTERSCYNVYSCEICRPELLPIKRYGQCKSFCGQTNGQAKNYMPPIYRCRSIKMWKISCGRGEENTSDLRFLFISYNVLYLVKVGLDSHHSQKISHHFCFFMQLFVFQMLKFFSAIGENGHFCEPQRTRSLIFDLFFLLV